MLRVCGLAEELSGLGLRDIRVDVVAATSLHDEVTPVPRLMRCRCRCEPQDTKRVADIRARIRSFHGLPRPS